MKNRFIHSILRIGFYEAMTHARKVEERRKMPFVPKPSRPAFRVIEGGRLNEKPDAA